MGQLTEIIWAAGILVVVVVFGINSKGPHEGVHKIPACINGKTEDVWSDCAQRDVTKALGYCGVCGYPTDCPKVKCRYEERK